ncbi:MAG: AAA domain-containing protein [Acidobacteriota bacterium]
MSLSPANLLNYWRRCLADGELASPGSRNLSAEPVTWDDLDRGRLSEKTRQALLRDVPDPTEDGAGDPVDVRIALCGLRGHVSHGKSKNEDKFYAPCWIPARLHPEEGVLTPIPDARPWLVREHLSPQGLSIPALGTVDAMDRFLEDQPRPAGDTWGNLLTFAEEMFKAVLGESPRSFELKDYTQRGPAVLRGRTVQGAGNNLFWLYDYLEKRKSLPPLVRGLAAIGAHGQIDGWTADGHRSPPHLGQMTRRFPLGRSQRESLHAVLRLPPGKLVAINGPLGTGKTTLVQSMVASLWVERALEEAPQPPVIVACSTNNQAVTNVLDSLKAAADPRDGRSTLGRRWLGEEVDSYGLYFPAKSKMSAAKHLWAATSGESQVSAFETEEFVDAAGRGYLDAARGFFGDSSLDTVQEVVKCLRGELKAEAGRLRSHLEVARRVIETRERLGHLDPEVELARLSEARRGVMEEIADAQRLLTDVDGVIAATPLVEDLLAFWGPIRERRDHRLTRPFATRHLPIPQIPLRDWRGFLSVAAAAGVPELEERLKGIDDEARPLQAWIDLEADFEARVLQLAGDRAELSDELPQAVLRDPAELDALLDPTVRWRLFQLAGRYWEGRWLLELSGYLEDRPERLRGQSRENCEARLRRFAMLSPLFVSTLHSLPNVFKSKDEAEPLLEAIDLLIVDEAGQVAPEIGAPAFALAKRAVVIGDTWQIEPIWGINRAIDPANMRLSKLDRSQLREDGTSDAISSASGSLMRIAQRSSHFSVETEKGRRDGMWLREHRRSVPTIIGYCNDLVYKGRLEPKREPIEDLPLPAMGWAHVHSPSRRVGASRSNPGHAEAIAIWLRERRQEIEAYYRNKDGDAGIQDLVGIVTPYRPQVTVLQSALKAADLPVEKKEGPGILVGTVHSFQGAERPVMLFSPTVTRDDASRFFDISPHMLNVAVSRARDSFLVFGDMEVFDPASAPRPSGVLARHLFARPENELVDVLAAPDLARLRTVERLSGHLDHQRALAQALEEGKEILIVSPYLGRALEDGDLLDRIRGAVQRGAKIKVAYCKDLPRASEWGPWVRLLRKAGVVVVGLDRIHAKTLVVDLEWIVEGSYNWLSAVRDPGHPYHRHEASLLCRRPEAYDMALTAREQVKDRETGARSPRRRA